MAIQSNELRIGNIVLDPYGNQREVMGVHGHYVWLKGNHGDDRTYPESDLSPVPLTPELIEKCGFVWEDIVTKSDGGTEKMLCKGFIFMMINEVNGAIAACPYGYPLSPHRTKYAHQLANLYFALTGEELEVKP